MGEDRNRRDLEEMHYINKRVSQALTQGIEARLRGAVRRRLGLATEGAPRGDVDDPAAVALLGHVTGRGPGGVGGA